MQVGLITGTPAWRNLGHVQTMGEVNNFQRIGSISNAHVGADFELAAKVFFEKDGLILNRDHRVEIGFGAKKKERRFDLGSDDPSVLIECKSHTWTASGNSPSAKLTVWNEAMLYFHLAPSHYRKILFALKSIRHGQTLAAYYVRCHEHLIPSGVEIWEHDPIDGSTSQLHW